MVVKSIEEQLDDTIILYKIHGKIYKSRFAIAQGDHQSRRQQACLKIRPKKKT